MKVRTFFSALSVVVITLLMIGIGCFWGITAGSPLNLIQRGGQPVPASTVFVPAQSPMMLSLLTRPDRLTDVWRLLAAPNLRDEAQNEITRLERTLLAGAQLTYEQDIRPWLGDELTFAITASDFDEDISNGQQPGYLLALSCRNKALAKETLELYWQKQAIAGARLVFENFLGSQLIYARTPVVDGGDSRASAVVADRFVLFANDPQVLRQALTAAQANSLNLQHDTEYLEALATLPKRRIALAVVNLPKSLQLLGLATDMTQLTVGIDSDDALIDRALFSIRLQREGIIADTALLAAPGHAFPARQPTKLSTQVAEFLVEGAPFAAISYDLAHQWQFSKTLFSRYGLPLKETAFSSLDLSDGGELTNWINGEYALGMMVDAPSRAPDWIMVSQRHENSETALHQLDHLAQRKGLSIGALQLGEHLLTAWSRLVVHEAPSSRPGAIEVKTEIIGLHGQVSDYELWTTSATAMNRTLYAAKPLLSTSNWKTAIAPLENPNWGYLYLNWPRLSPSLSVQFPWLRLLQATADPLLTHVKTIVATGYGSTTHMQSGAIFIHLGNA